MATTALGTVIPGWALDDAAAMERLDVELLTRAYRFSERAHAGQKRSSGDAYVSHCVEVAKILAELHLDSVTVASGLIHDVIEDTGVNVDEIEREFGTEIASIVDGVTKIGNITFRSTQERQVENYRKLLLSVAKDARVILIKLADRLHNMRTLDYLRRRSGGASRRRRWISTLRSRTASGWRSCGGSSRTCRSSISRPTGTRASPSSWPRSARNAKGSSRRCATRSSGCFARPDSRTRR